MDESGRRQHEEGPTDQGKARCRAGQERHEAATGGRRQQGGHDHGEGEKCERLTSAGQAEAGACQRQAAGPLAQVVALKNGGQAQEAEGGAEGLEHDGALIDKAQRVNGHYPAGDGRCQGTAVADGPAQCQYADRLDQRHGQPSPGKGGPGPDIARPQAERQHQHRDPGRLVVYKAAVRQGAVRQAHGRAEPDPVVVLEVLVPFPHAQQLVPAYGQAEGGGQGYDQDNGPGPRRARAGRALGARPRPHPLHRASSYRHR